MPTIIYRTISSILYLGGLVMTGIGGWYDYQQTLIMPDGPFGWSILLWGIALAAIGSLLLICQMWYKIWKLESLKPSILVTIPEAPTVNNDWSLDIFNNGERGKFEAQLTLLAVRLNDWIDTKEFSSWKGIWDSTRTNYSDIMKGHHDSIRIVNIFDTVNGPILRLLGYSVDKQSEIEIKNFGPKNFFSQEITIRIEIIISSHPSMKNEIFKRVYEVTPFDMVKINSKGINFRNLNKLWQ